MMAALQSGDAWRLSEELLDVTSKAHAARPTRDQ
jgi:hypothetical protein